MEWFGNNKEAILRDLECQVDSMLQLINRDMAGEYLEALALVPALVQRESRVIDFLRTEDYHALKAARRIALYWKTRKEIFGERWLLPMTQTGAGTLTMDQVELLRTGFKVRMNAPQPMAISDTSKVPASALIATNTYPAIMFYLQSVNTCEQGQTDGVTILHVINRGVQARSSILCNKEIMKKIADSLPFKLKKIIVARAFHSEQDDLLECLAFRQKNHAQNNFGIGDYIIGESVRSTLDLLEQSGLDRACIPFSLGGNYFYSRHFNDWVRERLSVEDAMVAAPPVWNTAKANAVAAKVLLETVATPAASVNHITLSDSHNDSDDGALVRQKLGESHQDFKHRRSLVYSNRSYHKRQRAHEELRTRAQCLQEINTALRADKRRLEALLTRARLVVSVLYHSAEKGKDQVSSEH